MTLVSNAMARAASTAHLDLQQGLNTLATITSIAPFIGILATLWGIGFETFGPASNIQAGLAMVGDGISLALVPAALGLFVALHSLAAYKILHHQLAQLDLDMAHAPLGLMQQLALQPLHPPPDRPSDPIRPSLPFLEAYSPHWRADQQYERRMTRGALALALLTWCLQAIAYFTLDAVPLFQAMLAAFRFVLIAFCASCLPVYPLWVRLLQRKPPAVALIAATGSLAWCLAGLFFPAIRF